MKPLRNQTHFYQNIYIPLIIIYLLFTVSLGFIGFEFLNVQYTQKIKLLGNITGAVLSENPALENILVDAIQDTEGRHAGQVCEAVS